MAETLYRHYIGGPPIKVQWMKLLLLLVDSEQKLFPVQLTPLTPPPPPPPPPPGDFSAADDYFSPQLKEDDHFGSLLRTFPPPSSLSDLHLTDKTLASHVAVYSRTAVVFYIKCEPVLKCPSSDLCILFLFTASLQHPH